MPCLLVLHGEIPLPRSYACAIPLTDPPLPPPSLGFLAGGCCTPSASLALPLPPPPHPPLTRPSADAVASLYEEVPCSSPFCTIGLWVMVCVMLVFHAGRALLVYC